MKTSEKGKIGKKEIRQIFFRSCPMEASFNYERMMSLAFAYCMDPIIKKLYTDKEKRKEAMKRHLEFFNTTSAMAPFIVGVAAAMEEKNAEDETFDTASINAMKAGLMGPLAGIGDSIFWGTLRIITAGIGVSLAQQGNILGPFLFIILFNVPNYLVRYYGALYGYNLGANFIDKLSSSGLMDKITYAINILGITVIGAMTASMVTVNIPITFGGGEQPQTIQSVLDGIMPCMLPLGLTFFVYYLLRKKVKVTYIILGLVILSILGVIFGFLK
ncbi:MAG: PTS system mannose/fructose/sorbose family transporter subunit IID [Bacillota bacterium]|nr:PTS system mannose/fructose/sorbose family transporter subunit IID [Bacillota bacterium]